MIIHKVMILVHVLSVPVGAPDIDGNVEMRPAVSLAQKVSVEQCKYEGYQLIKDEQANRQAERDLIERGHTIEPRKITTAVTCITLPVNLNLQSADFGGTVFDRIEILEVSND